MEHTKFVRNFWILNSEEPYGLPAAYMNSCRTHNKINATIYNNGYMHVCVSRMIEATS